MEDKQQSAIEFFEAPDTGLQDQQAPLKSLNNREWITELQKGLRVEEQLEDGYAYDYTNTVPRSTSNAAAPGQQSLDPRWTVANNNTDLAPSNNVAQTMKHSSLETRQKNSTGLITENATANANKPPEFLKVERSTGLATSTNSAEMQALDTVSGYESDDTVVPKTQHSRNDRTWRLPRPPRHPQPRDSE